MVLWPSAMLGSPFGGADPAPYDPSALILFSRMTVQPDNTRKQLISDCIAALKTAGLWTKMVGLWFTAAHDAQAGRLNWVAGTQGLSEVGTVTFETDRGYTGNGTTGYLQVAGNPFAIAPYAQNSMAMGGWSRTDNLGAYPLISDSTLTQAFVFPRRLASTMRTRAQAASTNDFTLGSDTGVGLSAISRTAAGAIAGYKDGAPIGTASTASAAITATSLRLLNGSTSFSIDQVAFAFVGSGMNDADMLALYNAVLTFLTAIGAA